MFGDRHTRGQRLMMPLWSATACWCRLCGPCTRCDQRRGLRDLRAPRQSCARSRCSRCRQTSLHCLGDDPLHMTCSGEPPPPKSVRHCTVYSSCVLRPEMCPHRRFGTQTLIFLHAPHCSTRTCQHWYRRSRYGSGHQGTQRMICIRSDQFHLGTYGLYHHSWPSQHCHHTCAL